MTSSSELVCLKIPARFTGRRIPTVLLAQPRYIIPGPRTTDMCSRSPKLLSSRVHTKSFNRIGNDDNLLRSVEMKVFEA